MATPGVNHYPDNNPKSITGIKKVPLHLNPPAAIIYMALGFQDGAVKYGPYNWRDNKVAASVYIGAALRHIADWWDREDVAEDSKKPHIGHALACLAIVADAIETGNLVDDRPTKGAASGLMKKWELK